MKILSIDAWREREGGWTWNNWHKAGTVPDAWAHLPARALLHRLRDDGYGLPAGSVRVEDDGYNRVICMRATGEPLLALAYGEAING